MPKEKVYVPVVEPKSTSYVEYTELGRTVTSCPVFKKDTIRVRLLQRNLGNPAETFDTEKHWEYDVPWPVGEVKEIVVEKQQVKEEETLLQKITPFKRTK